MTVREFNGTSDELVTDIGAASGMVFGTVAMLLKFSTLSGFHEFCMIHNSGNAFVANPIGLTNFTAFEVNYNTGSSDFSVHNPTPGTDIWLLVVARKATGTSTPRLSMFNYTSGLWTHGDGSAAIADGSAPGVGAVIRFSFQGANSFFGGRVAARALWANSLPWAADTTGDAAIEAAGLKDAASSWLDADPTLFQLFNQPDAATPVEDLSTDGTGGQIGSAIGTAAVEGDDPPGFTFALGAAFSGSVDLSGSGALSPTGSPSTGGSVGLSGAGTATPNATPAIPGQVTLAGGGSLAPAGQPTLPGDLPLSGGGTLTQAGVPAATGRLALSGVGVLVLPAPPWRPTTLTVSNAPASILGATNTPTSQLEASHGV